MKIKDVNKSYGDNIVLECVNAEWNRVGMVFLLGRSGSGKSTLLNILGKLDDCTSGDVVFGTGAESEEGLRRDYLTYIFQEYNLLNQKTVRENLQVALNIAGIPWDEARVASVLEELGVSELCDRQVAVLSGGEKQRVAIARAVLKGSRVILADEPTGNLDEENAITCMELLKKISKTGLIVVVTHDVELAERYADCIYRIENKDLVKVCDNGYEVKAPLEEYHEVAKEDKRGWVYSYSLKRFGEQFKRKLSIISVLTLVLMSLMMVLGIFSATNRLVNEVNTSLLENDFYTVLCPEEGEKDIENVIRDASAILKDDANVKEMIVYGEQTLFVSSGKEGDSENARGIIPLVVRNNKFFLERYSDLVGAFPTSRDEIIVNENFVRLYMGASNAKAAVGNSIVVKVNSMEYTLKISGVRTKEEAAEDAVLVYILEDLHKEFQKNAYQGLVPELHGEGWTSEIRIFDQEKLVAGVAPNAENELAVSRGTYAMIYQITKMLEGKYLSEEEIWSLSEEEKIECLLDTWITLNDGAQGDDKMYKIVGVVANDENCVIYIDDRLVERYANMVNKIDVYIEDISDEAVEEMQYALSRLGAYASSNSLRTTKDLGAKFIIFLTLMAIVTVILIVITVVMSSFVAKSSVNERFYEVGVLKGLGASRREVFGILMLDNLYVACAGVGICLGVWLILQLTGATRLLVIGGVPVYVFAWWHLPVVVVSGVLVNVIASCGSIRQASKVTIIDSIRKKVF